MSDRRILIVGGVAGGASCAARARRLSEKAKIIIFERGPFVSFANCGLPYYVGNAIAEEQKLLVATAELFQQRFKIEVRLENEVLAIDRKTREIKVKNLKTGEIYQEPYDALVLATGASPIRPALPGIDLPGIFALRTIPDSRSIRNWLEKHQAKQAAIVGGGFIGLEMTENLLRRGIDVTLIERKPQVMPAFDPEMVSVLSDRLTANGVQLCLGEGVNRFEARAEESLTVVTDSGKQYPADLVILAMGVRPETDLAVAAGLEIGRRGGIRTNEQMQTSDDRIWAVGDVVEVKDWVTGEWTLVPLAGPANRQGRVAAASICGREVKFRGVQRTAVCQVLGLTLANTGANEKTLQQVGSNYEKVYLHPGHHASYYPGAKPIHIKLLFSPQDGRILGAQAVGEEGVEKRIDVISLALQHHSTVFDLEEAELCYAPQFGAAKDPVNLAGMIAANALRGDAPLAYWEHLDLARVLLLDVREVGDFSTGHIEGAINIPLSQLRDRLKELPKDKEIWVYCRVGQRGYYATRVLRLNGFEAHNLTGGLKSFQT